MFSEVDSAFFDARPCAFSVATPGAYFRESVFSEVPPPPALRSGSGRGRRRRDGFCCYSEAAAEVPALPMDLSFVRRSGLGALGRSHVLHGRIDLNDAVAKIRMDQEGLD